VFHPAAARIVSNDTVELICAEVNHPASVRYAWHNWIEPGNPHKNKQSINRNLLLTRGGWCDTLWTIKQEAAPGGRYIAGTVGGASVQMNAASGGSGEHQVSAMKKENRKQEECA